MVADAPAPISVPDGLLAVFRWRRDPARAQSGLFVCSVESTDACETLLQSSRSTVALRQPGLVAPLFVATTLMIGQSVLLSACSVGIRIHDSETLIGFEGFYVILDLQSCVGVQ